MKKFFIGNKEFVIAFLILTSVISAIFIQSTRENEGHFVYGLDDAYIHMSMAKNLVDHQVWGITKYSFSSSSSSIVWPLILSFFFLIAGVNELIPFILNFILAVILLWTVHRILLNYRLPSPFRAVILILLIFITPLPALIISGMEHILQILGYVLFIYLSSLLLSGEVENAKIKIYKICIVLLALAVTLTRYEGFALVGIFVFFFFIKKEFRFGTLMLLTAIAPIIIYGIISLNKGWFFLPNSVILKGMHPTETITDILNMLTNRYELLMMNMHVFFFLVLSPLVLALYFVKNRNRFDSITIMMTANYLMLILHFLTFRYNWLFRYEAYLIAIGLILNSTALYKIVINTSLSKSVLQLPKFAFSFDGIIFKAAKLLLVVFTLMAFTDTLHDRAETGTKWAPIAMNDRYLEHVYTAKFLKEFYNNSTVVLNDVGTIGFYTDAKILDLYGLASFEPAKLAPYLFTSSLEVFRKKAGDYRQTFADWISKNNGEIAILQTGGWFINYYIPKEWIKVGMWEIPSNVVFGDREISFFCTDKKYKDKLTENLRIFSSRLPTSIKQSGLYTKKNDVLYVSLMQKRKAWESIYSNVGLSFTPIKAEIKAAAITGSYTPVLM